MLSLLGSGLDSCVGATSNRSVSGASSPRFGLDAELPELERSGRVVSAGFSNVHCWSCEATATSTMVPAGTQKLGVEGGRGKGDVIVEWAAAAAA
jgi:hypothetical protein